MIVRYFFQITKDIYTRIYRNLLYLYEMDGSIRSRHALRILVTAGQKSRSARLVKVVEIIGPRAGSWFVLTRECGLSCPARVSPTDLRQDRSRSRKTFTKERRAASRQRLCPRLRDFRERRNERSSGSLRKRGLELITCDSRAL